MPNLEVVQLRKRLHDLLLDVAGEVDAAAELSLKTP